MRCTPIKPLAGEDHADPLLWWKNRADRFRNLAKIAKQYLAIQATSAASERLFSKANLLLADTRSQMDPSFVNYVLGINGNLEWYEETISSQ